MVGVSPPYKRARIERNGRSAEEDNRSSKTTRVWTLRVPLTAEVPMYLASLNLDGRVWAVATGRSLAADYHASILTALGPGVLASSAETDHIDQETPAELRVDFATAVDKLVKDIAKNWYLGSFNFDQASTDKILTVIKMLFLLRAGPCLGGQLMDASGYAARARRYPLEILTLYPHLQRRTSCVCSSLPPHSLTLRSSWRRVCGSSYPPCPSRRPLPHACRAVFPRRCLSFPPPVFCST